MTWRSFSLPAFLFLLFAQSAAQAQFTYTNIGNGITITAYTGSARNVTISNYVVIIGAQAFEGSQVTNVTIPDSVTTIESSAFQYTALTSVTIPKNVTSIGTNAFFNCFFLTAINVDPGNLVFSSLGGVLCDYSQTTLLEYPGGTGSNFYAIPNGITSIGPCAFYFSSLTNVSIPGNVTSIGDDAFYGCPFTSVTLPESVTNIGGAVFQTCNYLTNVMIGSNVTGIGPGAFGSDPNLTVINVDPGNPVFSNVDGVLFGYSQTSLLAYPPGKTGNSFAIPGGVTNIGDFAFAGCSLTNVTIPGTVFNIGNNAFNDCSLTSVTIPDSVTNIGAGAFSYCLDLTNLVIGQNVATIGAAAFRQCGVLTNLTIPPSVLSIGADAFNQCFGFTSMTIPDTVTNLGDDAFNSCYALGSVTLGNGITSIGYLEFGSCQGLTNVTFGTNVTSIGMDAFNACLSLSNITIPGTVTNISNLAFSICGLTNVVIPDSVTSLGAAAFIQCDHLLSVTIGSGLTNILDVAFNECTSLAAINVDPGNPAFSSVAGMLLDKSQKTFLECPSGIVGNCTIPDGVTSVAAYSFETCWNLTDVIFPDTVTFISVHAFNNCPGLRGLYFVGNIPTLGSYGVIGTDIGQPNYYNLPGRLGWAELAQPWHSPAVLMTDGKFGVQNNAFGFTLLLATNTTIVVETSTNLANPVWQPLQTNTLPYGTFFFSDPQWTNYPGRFYRIAAH